MDDEFWRSNLERWHALTPEARFVFIAAGVLVATFIASTVIGWLVGRRLRAGHFDAAFRRPWLPAPVTVRPDAHAFTPTRLIVGLVRLTIWGAGLWCLARAYDWTDLIRWLPWFAGRVWSFVLVILVALYLSRVFSGKLVEVVQTSPLKHKLEEWLPAVGTREPRVSGAAVVAGLLIDAVVILLVSLVAADLMGWELTGTALAATWQLLLHLFAAGVALLIGWTGARWVRAQVVTDPAPASSPARVSHAIGTSVMGCATLLAILLLAGNYPAYLGLILLVVFVLLLWPAQAWLPDIYAGAVLRVQQVKQVRIENVTYPLGPVGLVQTQLVQPEGNQARRNRVILEAHLANPVTTAPGSALETSQAKPEEAGTP
jgi:hypothetical protein